MDSALDVQAQAPLHPSMLHGLMGGYVYYDHVVRRPACPSQPLPAASAHPDPMRKPRALQEGLGFPGRALGAAACLHDACPSGLGPALARRRWAAAMTGVHGELALAHAFLVQHVKAASPT